MIRELRQEDAEAVARLGLAVNPDRIYTAELVRRGAADAAQRDWVVEADGEIIGHAYAVRTGSFWVGVAAEHRRRGFGGRLYELVEDHVGSARRLRTRVDGEPAGDRFVARRGFRLSGADRVADLDPRRFEVGPLPELASGHRLVPLAEALGRVEALFERCRTGRVDLPADLAEWKWDELEHPHLSREGSFVVLDGAEPVSLGFLTVDRERRVAYNVLTATLPAHRRRGLARVVKLATIGWARAHGIERLLTENDRENTGMLALNDSLGYRPLYDQGIWALDR